MPGKPTPSEGVTRGNKRRTASQRTWRDCGNSTPSKGVREMRGNPTPSEGVKG